jgi:dCMP deaminase
MEHDEKFILLALGQRLHSDDPKAAWTPQSGVGAVIVGNDGVISQSANILPPRLKKFYTSESLQVSDVDRYHIIEHAERASIYKALLQGISLAGTTMYCSRFPCSDCARAIVWVGIERVVLAAGHTGETRWLEAQRAAEEILQRAGVVVDIHPLTVESPLPILRYI